mgnify:FL=1
MFDPEVIMRRQTHISHYQQPCYASASGKLRLLAGVAINTAGAFLLFAESFRYLNPVL